ncbi:MAG: carboxypeptidase-like regulatory domain-containing protein [Thermoanaerobaculia bacterium]|nr:carboxypeptidase-like regulatory domain-containing protein [Thermoanaerobaculia bacterium]
MTDRRERLNLLTVAEPCPEPWETMAGDGATRHCARCNRSVHDFAALSPREIERLLRHSRGQVCGRLTRRPDGQLLTREERVPSSNEAVERPSRLAAALVAGLLGGLGAPLGAQPASPPAATTTADPESDPRPQRDPAEDPAASLFGRVTSQAGEPVANVELRATNTLDRATVATFTDADGRFVFVGLSSGLWEIAGGSEDWTVDEVYNLQLTASERRGIELTAREGVIFTGGSIAVPGAPLWSQVRSAQLVVAGIVGESTPVDPEDDSEYVELVTELHVTSILAGDPGAEVIRLSHVGLRTAAEDGLSRGARALALLEPSDEPGTWQDVSYDESLRRLEDDELRALERWVDEVRELELEAPGGLAELADRLVEAALDPLTRPFTIMDLGSAVYRLGSEAESQDRSLLHTAEDRLALLRAFTREGGKLAERFPDSLLAAHLTEAHRRLLTGALVASPLSVPNFHLFRIVERWAPEVALEWLIPRVRKSGVSDDWDGWMIARGVAERVEGELFREFVELYPSNEAELPAALDHFRAALSALPAQRF